MIDPAPQSRFDRVRPWVGLVARLILGGILVVAGGMKIFDLKQSVIAVEAYQFPIPGWMESLIGHGLPVVEILLGLAIATGLATRWSALLGGLMMAAYIAGIASAWARGLSIDCGCLTPGGSLIDPKQKTKYVEDILRDVGLIACAAWLVVWPGTRWSLDHWLRPAQAPDWDVLPEPDENLR